MGLWKMLRTWLTLRDQDRAKSPARRPRFSNNCSQFQQLWPLQNEQSPLSLTTPKHCHPEHPRFGCLEAQQTVPLWSQSRKNPLRPNLSLQKSWGHPSVLPPFCLRQ